MAGHGPSFFCRPLLLPVVVGLGSGHKYIKISAFGVDGRTDFEVMTNQNTSAVLALSKLPRLFINFYLRNNVNKYARVLVHQYIDHDALKRALVDSLLGLVAQGFD